MFLVINLHGLKYIAVALANDWNFQMGIRFLAIVFLLCAVQDDELKFIKLICAALSELKRSSCSKDFH